MYENIPVDILKEIIKIKNSMDHYEKYKNCIREMKLYTNECQINFDVINIYIYNFGGQNIDYDIEICYICKNIIIYYRNCPTLMKISNKKNFCMC